MNQRTVAGGHDVSLGRLAAGPFRVELLSGFQRVAAADGVRPGGPEVRLVVPGK